MIRILYLLAKLLDIDNIDKSSMLSSMKGYPRGSESSSRQLINFEALKQLKHTSQEYNTLCNRIRVMEANEERNMRKAENSE